MSAKNIILYSYWRSSCSWRIRAVLEHKQLKYEIRTVSLKKGDQKKPDFLKVNPFGFVPTLVVETQDGKSITVSESLAIIDYLENAFPDTPSVYPTDLVTRAQVSSVTSNIISGIQPIQNIGVLQMVSELTARPLHEWANHWITDKFGKLEQFLQAYSGKYTVGDEFSIADICLVPQVYNALRYKVDVDKFPIVAKLTKQLMADEGGVLFRTRPESQPDAFEEGP